MPLRIATTQPVATSDARENGSKARELMRQAAAQGTRLIHFPEAFLSGYAKEQIADWDDVDWAAVREELRAIAQLAAELWIWVVLGSAHPLTPPNRPHNSLYVISDQGDVVNRYDKRFCSNTEITRFFSPGFEPVVFDVDGYRFGCAICIEVNFPSLFVEYDRLGVDCLLLSAWPVDSIFFLKARSHAAIHNYWLSLSVQAQSADLMPSAIIGPDGSEMASIHAPEELTIATLDRDAPEFHIAVNLARPWRAEANQGDIYRSRRVDDPGTWPRCGGWRCVTATTSIGVESICTCSPGREANVGVNTPVGRPLRVSVCRAERHVEPARRHPVCP